MFLYKEPWSTVIYILNAFHNKQEVAQLDNWETEYCSSENSPKTVRVVLVCITGHGIFKVQYTLHNVWGKVTVIRLCILILKQEAEAAWKLTTA